ncbi:hypothetical protein MTO96_000525 [Rhipicephalus appendiculatus]
MVELGKPSEVAPNHTISTFYWASPSSIGQPATFTNVHEPPDLHYLICSSSPLPLNLNSGSSTTLGFSFFCCRFRIGLLPPHRPTISYSTALQSTGFFL